MVIYKLQDMRHAAINEPRLFGDADKRAHSHMHTHSQTSNPANQMTVEPVL